MPGCWIDPRAVVHDPGLACKAEDFGVNAILHTQRAEVDHPIRQAPDERSQLEQNAVQDYRLIP
jgi:hypothetical protein